MLIVDHNVLVEQYHYGKAVPEEYLQQGSPPILGKDMALLEYCRTTERRLVDESSFDASRNSYDLLVDHFMFVFERCSAPL